MCRTDQVTCQSNKCSDSFYRRRRTPVILSYPLCKVGLSNSIDHLFSSCPNFFVNSFGFLWFFMLLIDFIFFLEPKPWQNDGACAPHSQIKHLQVGQTIKRDYNYKLITWDLRNTFETVSGFDLVFPLLTGRIAS